MHVRKRKWMRSCDQLRLQLRRVWHCSYDREWNAQDNGVTVAWGEIHFLCCHHLHCKITILHKCWHIILRQNLDCLETSVRTPGSPTTSTCDLPSNTGSDDRATSLSASWKERLTQTDIEAFLTRVAFKSDTSTMGCRIKGTSPVEFPGCCWTRSSFFLYVWSFVRTHHQWSHVLRSLGKKWSHVWSWKVQEF